MKKIAMHRGAGSFITTKYKVERAWDPGGEHQIRPRLCAGATSRVFGLGQGAQQVEAVFSVKKPKNCVKSYKIRSYNTYSGLQCGTLVGFGGSFLEGVTLTLGNMYAEGYRYVRIERVL